MTEMVERVARIIHAIDEGSGNWDPWEKDQEDSRKYCRELARSIFKSMREPTEAMIVAGKNGMPFAGPVAQTWQAMIDEALK